jgi:ABC-2 type transport system permease protein
VVLGGIANCVTRDRMFGTLQFTYVSRGSRAATYFSKGVMHFPNALVVVVVGLISAWTFLGLGFERTDWPALVISILVIALSSTGAALLIGNFGIIINDWSTAYGAFVGAMLALTGVIIPVDSLPAFLRPLSQALPFTHGLAAFRSAFAGGSLPSIGNNLLLELAIGAVYAAVGLVMYRWMEQEAKRRGILDTPGG